MVFIPSSSFTFYLSLCVLQMFRDDVNTRDGPTAASRTYYANQGKMFAVRQRWTGLQRLEQVWWPHQTSYATFVIEIFVRRLVEHGFFVVVETQLFRCLTGTTNKICHVRRLGACSPHLLLSTTYSLSVLSSTSIWSFLGGTCSPTQGHDLGTTSRFIRDHCGVK